MEAGWSALPGMRAEWELPPFTRGHEQAKVDPKGAGRTQQGGTGPGGCKRTRGRKAECGAAKEVPA